MRNEAVAEVAREVLEKVELLGDPRRAQQSCKLLKAPTQGTLPYVDPRCATVALEVEEIDCKSPGEQIPRAAILGQ